MAILLISPHDSSYMPGSVRSLIESDLLTAPTRDVLRSRLRKPMVVDPQFFGPDDFATVSAVCDRLIPQGERPRPIDVAGALDTRLAEGGGDGWRYAAMPSDAEMHVAGIAGIEQASTALFGRGFTHLSEPQQDAVLLALQRGSAAGSVWAAMDGALYFEELLALVVDVYYSHPLASEEIGCVSMADGHGWQAIGLDEREAHEPVSAAKQRGAA
jgi:hypothetical protein